MKKIISRMFSRIALFFIKEKQVINCFDRQGEPVTENDKNCYFCRRYMGKDAEGNFIIQDFYNASNKKRSDPIKVKNRFYLNKLNPFPDHHDSNSKVIGDLLWWYENGKKWHQSSITDGVYEGKLSEWYENGQRFKEYRFVEGNKEGLCTLWYDNGQKYIENNYHHDLPEGLWTEWYQNGQKHREGLYLQEKKETSWRFWKEDGTELPTRLIDNENE